MAELKDKLENALNEARILILGGQVLIGVNYRSFFETEFEHLTRTSQLLLTVGLGLMLVGLGLLVGPASYHRIVERDKISDSFNAFVTGVLSIGLFPFALALGADMYVAGEKVGGGTTALVAALASTALALLCWYGLEFWKARSAPHRTAARGRITKKMASQGKSEEPKLSDRVKEVLTEARMVLPGAQALLGFQFIIMLMEGFDKIPASSRYVHFASLSAITISTIFLIMPAAYHRMVLLGEDNQEFTEFAGRMLLIAMFFLGLGVSGDFLVVCRKVTGSLNISLIVSLALLAFFYGFWFGWTHYRRAHPVSAR